GWLCMSCRQPLTMANPAAANSNHATRICAGRLIRHLRDLLRIKALQQLSCIGDAEPWVLRFYAKEEPIAAGAHKVRRIKYRMIRLRQTIEREHSKYGRQRCAQHRAFKRHRNKRRPGMERLAAYVERIINH